MGVIPVSPAIFPFQIVYSWFTYIDAYTPWPKSFSKKFNSLICTATRERFQGDPLSYQYWLFAGAGRSGPVDHRGPLVRDVVGSISCWIKLKPYNIYTYRYFVWSLILIEQDTYWCVHYQYKVAETDIMSWYRWQGISVGHHLKAV